MIPQKLVRAVAKWATGLFLIVAITTLAERLTPTPEEQADKQASLVQDQGKVPAIKNTDAHMISLPGGIGYPAMVTGPLRSGELITAQGYGKEIEPNDTFGTATPLGGSNVVVQANIVPNADVDFYSFTAGVGDRVYAAVMTAYSASIATDSTLTLFASDGTTLIEFDNDNGSFSTTSSTIAGRAITVAGTYYLRVASNTATTQIRPYDLHFRLQTGAPVPEVEGNDTPATANPLPASGWVSGARNPAVATEQDWFSMTLAAGDTVYLALDLDPERDGVTWNGRLGFALFGDAGNQILVVDDAGAAEPAPALATIPSEAMFFTVKTAGTYYAFVDSATAATGGPTATYNLSVSVHPSTNEGVNCTTYTSTNVPVVINDLALSSSTLTVPGSHRIQDLDVSIALNHTFIADLDVHLRSPANNDNGVFSDVFNATVGGQTLMDMTFDDEAAIPPSFTISQIYTSKPRAMYHLSWYDGEDAGGTWTLDIRDDAAGDTGTLTAWSIRVCEQPPAISCPGGTTTV